jgi:23S rRNA (adenine1618-N6)-methyltransferase
MGNRKQAAPARGQEGRASAPDKQGLHPRNRHRACYDFTQLVQSCPELAPFVAINAYGDASIDFADPAAVRTLNRALLAHFYGVSHWEIPANYLCPPIPGRADYIHYAADLLASCNAGVIPRGCAVRALDLGTGANCVYPILGSREYGWRFLGSDIDSAALASAQQIVRGNPGLAEAIELRLQASPDRILRGLLREGETFDLTLCNPPFHASPEEARAGSQRKWRNLGKGAAGAPVLNFGGQGGELWCPGGEAALIGRLIEESAEMPERCLWFTTLVSKASNLPGARAALKRAGVAASRTFEMAQGQKQSRIVAWTFLGEPARNEWRRAHWEKACT